MARQKGLIRLLGRIGNVTFYEKNGETYARLSEGIDGDLIKTDRRFRRTRENMAEFGGAAQAGKALRRALPEIFQTFGNGRVAARLTAVMRRIIGRGPGDRGQRALEVVAQKTAIVGFHPDPQFPLAEAFSGTYALSTNTDRNEVTASIDAFDPDVRVRAPRGTTHLRLVLGIGALSDHLYDAQEEGYVPADPALTNVGATVRSAELPLNAPVAALDLVAALPGAPVIGADAGVIVALGIEFVQEVNGSFYLLEDGNAMTLVDVV